LLDEVRKLTELEQAVIYNRFYYDNSLSETAAILGKPFKEVMQAYCMAITTLQDFVMSI